MDQLALAIFRLRHTEHLELVVRVEEETAQQPETAPTEQPTAVAAVARQAQRASLDRVVLAL